MKLFFSLFTVHLRQAIISIRFVLSVCGVTLVMLFTIWDLEVYEYADAIYFYGLALGGGIFVLITGILPLFPFATSFATEWNNRATNFWMVRTGVRNYSVSKVLASGISGFLTTAIGLVVFTLLMRIRLPLFVQSSTGDPYEYLLLVEMPISYLFFHITHISLTAALFAVIALWVSTYLPNKFVVLAAPLVLYFIVHRFTTQLDIPEYLKAMNIVEGMYNAGSPIATLLIKLGTVFIFCLLMGYGTVRQIRRRVQHD